eukprot:4065211-Pyramimonas_sp.AAC.2
MSAPRVVVTAAATGCAHRPNARRLVLTGRLLIAGPDRDWLIPFGTYRLPVADAGAARPLVQFFSLSRSGCSTCFLS